MHCAARSVKNATSLFECGYPSSSIKDREGLELLALRKSQLRVRKPKPDALFTVQTVLPLLLPFFFFL